MTEQTILDLATQSIWITVEIATPALAAALIVGLLVSIFQAATQINEQTLTFIPKIIAMTIAMVICGPWMMQTMLTFTTRLMRELPTYIR